MFAFTYWQGIGLRKITFDTITGKVQIISVLLIFLVSFVGGLYYLLSYDSYLERMPFLVDLVIVVFYGIFSAIFAILGTSVVISFLLLGRLGAGLGFCIALHNWANGTVFHPGVIIELIFESMPADWMSVIATVLWFSISNGLLHFSSFQSLKPPN